MSMPGILKQTKKQILFASLYFALELCCEPSVFCFLRERRKGRCGKNCTERVKSLTNLVRQPAVSHELPPTQIHAELSEWQLTRAEQTVPGKLQRGQATVGPTQPNGARQPTVGLVCHDAVKKNEITLDTLS